MNKLTKYIVGVGTMAALAGGVFMLSSVQAEEKQNKQFDEGRPAMVLQVNPQGHVLLRGTLKAMSTNSLTLTSWGGDWTVKTSSDTKIMPGGDMSKFKVGDFVGAQGTVDTTAAFTVNAKLVRDWNLKEEIHEESKENKKEIKDIMGRNWQGTVSNIGTGSFTLTIKGVAHTVTVASGAKIVNEKFMTISLADIKNDDTVRVWASANGTALTAYVVRDVSIK